MWKWRGFWRPRFQTLEMAEGFGGSESSILEMAEEFDEFGPLISWLERINRRTQRLAARKNQTKFLKVIWKRWKIRQKRNALNMALRFSPQTNLVMQKTDDHRRPRFRFQRTLPVVYITRLRLFFCGEVGCV